MAALRRFDSASTAYEKAEPELQRYLSLAKRSGNHYLQGIMYFNIGEYANVHEHHNEAFENKLYALRELETDPQKHYFGEYWMLHQIASEYYLFHDYDKTLQLCEPIYSATPAPGWDTWFMKITGNLIGMSHLRNGNTDSAKAWFERTNEMAVSSNDSAWQGIAIGNIGNVYFKEKKYPEAISHYKTALSLCKPQGLWDNVAAFSSSLADCYLRTGNLKEIPALLEDAKQAINKDEYHTAANYSGFFSVARSYYKTTGNAALALEYADSLAAYTIKDNEVFNVNKKLQAEAQLAYGNKELENEVDLQKIKQSQTMLYGLCIVLFLLTAIGVLLFKRQQLTHRLRNAELEDERLKAKQELSMSITEIRDFTRIVQEKNDLILQFMVEIDRLKQKFTGDMSSGQSAQIEQLRHCAVLTDQDLAKFNQLFEKAYPGFLDGLKGKYPQLTKYDICYLVFIKLELTAKEMSALLGVSAEAIREIRSAVQEKIHAENFSEIESVVAAL